MTMRHPAIPALLFLLVLMPATADQVPDLAGSWELDYELSEHPNDKLRFLYDVTFSHYQRTLNRSEVNPALISAVNRDLSGVVDLGRLTELITRSTVLTIDQQPDDIVVKRQGDFALSCEFDDAESSSPLGKESCGWSGEDLVFHVELPDGLSVNHRLVLSANGRRLNVATTVTSDKVSQPFTINRVYMPFEPGDGMFQCEYTLARKKTCYLGSPDE